MPKPPSLSRIKFFEKQVHHPKWKESMSGKNEDAAIKLIECCGFVLDTDFVRQHPIGERFVIDFAFIPEQVAIEIDGKNHDRREKKRMDTLRDKYLYANDWVPLRIKDSELEDINRMRFFKNLIREVVEERRQQWQSGSLFAIDVPHFIEEDYE